MSERRMMNLEVSWCHSTSEQQLQYEGGRITSAVLDNALEVELATFLLLHDVSVV